MIAHGCISPQGLRRMDYCNGVQGFINFTTSIPRNFTGGGIRCPYKKFQNKKYLHPDVVMMHLLHKGFVEDYECWYAHGEVFELEENSNFRVLDDSLVDIDREELNVVLSSSGQANVDEEDDIHIEDCDEDDDNSIDEEEEENSD